MNENKISIFRLLNETDTALTTALRKIENLYELSETRLRNDEIETIHNLADSSHYKLSLIESISKKFSEVPIKEV